MDIFGLYNKQGVVGFLKAKGAFLGVPKVLGGSMWDSPLFMETIFLLRLV